MSRCPLNMSISKKSSMKSEVIDCPWSRSTGQCSMAFLSSQGLRPFVIWLKIAFPILTSLPSRTVANLCSPGRKSHPCHHIHPHMHCKYMQASTHLRQHSSIRVKRVILWLTGRLVVGSWLFCIQHHPSLANFWCILGGSVEVCKKNILHSRWFLNGLIFWRVHFS